MVRPMTTHEIVMAECPKGYMPGPASDGPDAARIAERIVAGICTRYTLSDRQRAAAVAAIAAAPHAYVSRSGKTMRPVPLLPVALNAAWAVDMGDA